MRKKLFLYEILFMLVCVIGCNLTISNAYSTDSCISEIKVAKGKEAISELEEAGYIADYQDLNFASDTKECVYLGYKFGEDAITDIVVSNDLQSSLEINSITYTPVSDIDINEGIHGEHRYIYSTKDPEAGSKIAKLTKFKRTPKHQEKLPDFYGDGSEIIRNVDGAVVDFESDIEGYNLYFFMLRNALCLPYISEIKTVSVTPEDDLLEKLTSTHCDYYMCIPLYVSGDNTTYLCYNRTTDIDQAIRYVILSNKNTLGDIIFESAGSVDINGQPKELCYTKSLKIGSPMTDITLNPFSKEKFSLGQWASMYFEGKMTFATSMLCADEDYDELINSEEMLIQQTVKVYENESISKETDLYVSYIENGYVSSNEELNFNSNANSEKTDGSQVEHFNGRDFENPDLKSDDINYLEDGILRDTRDTDTTENIENSDIDEIFRDVAIGRGNTRVLVILSVIGVAGIGVFVYILYSKRKRKNKVNMEG